MEKTPYAVEMDVNTRKTTILFKEDVFTPEQDMSSDYSIEPTVANENEVMRYEQNNPCIDESKFREFANMHPIPIPGEEENKIAFGVPFDDKRSIVGNVEYGSNNCIICLQIDKNGRGSAFTFNSIAITAGHCLYGGGKWPNEIIAYHKKKGENLDSLIPLPKVKSYIIPYDHYEGKKWNDFGIITFEKKHPYGGMGIVASDAYDGLIKDNEVAVTGFPIDVRGEKGAYLQMWTENGIIQKMLPNNVPVYAYKISSSGGNSGCPLHYKPPKNEANHKWAAIGIHTGAWTIDGEVLNVSRAINSELANFFGKIAERENKAR